MGRYSHLTPGFKCGPRAGKNYLDYDKGGNPELPQKIAT